LKTVATSAVILAKHEVTSGQHEHSVKSSTCADQGRSSVGASDSTVMHSSQEGMKSVHSNDSQEEANLSLPGAPAGPGPPRGGGGSTGVKTFIPSD
jgi:hypothetical protein